MGKRLIRLLSAVIAVVITMASFVFAQDTKAAVAYTYDGTVKDYTIEKTDNYGKYFEPSEDGKYQLSALLPMLLWWRLWCISATILFLALRLKCLPQVFPFARR